MKMSRSIQVLNLLMKDLLLTVQVLIHQITIKEEMIVHTNRIDQDMRLKEIIVRAVIKDHNKADTRDLKEAIKDRRADTRDRRVIVRKAEDRWGLIELRDHQNNFCTEHAQEDGRG